MFELWGGLSGGLHGVSGECHIAVEGAAKFFQHAWRSYLGASHCDASRFSTISYAIDLGVSSAGERE